MLIRRSELHYPLDSEALFRRPGKLVLEIGFGDGRFLAGLAHRHPDWNLLGVEVSLASVSRAWRRMRREGIHAARLFKGNARFLVRDVLGEKALHRVYVNFPDPWPRKRHQDNRLLQSGFFDLVSTRLESGGSIRLTTDHEEYFEFARAEAAVSGRFVEEVLDPPRETLETKYALKWQADARHIQHVVWTLREAAPVVPPLIAIEPMQHALLTGDLSSVGEFTKQVRRFDGGAAVVTEAFRTMDMTGLLFTVVVEETDLRQELLVRVFEKEAGVHVGLQPFGDPLTTRGVREGLHAVTAWLQSQGLTLVKTWI